MRIVIATVLLLLSQPVFAFGKTGHQLVCDLAYQLVNSDTKIKLDTLLKPAPHTHFGNACSWPDEVRSQEAFKWSAPHHYVNMARGETAVSMQHCPAQGCILSAISDMQQRLAQNPADWQALLFLAHHIADLHQPLHVSFADDLGGNRTAVYFFGQPNNLHGVWDFALLKQLGYETEPTKANALLAQISQEQRLAWQQGDVLSWANESAAITVEIYQHYKPGMLLDEAYVKQYQTVLEQRVQQAAVRLAMLLDQLVAN